jgi:hypothetical protein
MTICYIFDNIRYINIYLFAKIKYQHVPYPRINFLLKIIIYLFVCMFVC